MELSDIWRAIRQIPPVQREALIMVGAGGTTYEQAAENFGVATGTIKSRVSRARATLADILEAGVTSRHDDPENADPVAGILDYFDRIAARLNSAPPVPGAMAA